MMLGVCALYGYRFPPFAFLIIGFDKPRKPEHNERGADVTRAQRRETKFSFPNENLGEGKTFRALKI
jgi:hypothetical protein